jgi:hypothetical protein
MSLAHTQFPSPYQDAFPADPGDWVVHDAVPSTVATGAGFPLPMEQTFHGYASNFTDSDVWLAPPSQSTEEHDFCGEGGQHFMQAPMGGVYGYGENYTDNLAASAVATDMQDPTCSPAPCDLTHHLACSVLSTAQAPVTMDRAFGITQLPQNPILSGPPLSELHLQAPPIPEQHSPPSDWREQLQQHLAGLLPPRNDPVWQAIKKQRLRAVRRQYESQNRKRHREMDEEMKSKYAELLTERAALLAQHKALTEENVALRDQLLVHAHCNDRAISEYLSSTSKKKV